MFPRIICRIGIVVAFSGGMAWAVVPFDGLWHVQATQYAHNNSDSFDEERGREIDRLLTPLGVLDAETDESAEPTKLPKARIRDPFYDFESALVAEVEAKAEAEKAANTQKTARSAPAIKRLVARPAGYRSTVSAAWRKLANIRRSVLPSQPNNRMTSRLASGRQTFGSSRWSSVDDDK